MQLKQLTGEPKNNFFFPSWIIVIVALAVLIGSVVWILAMLVPERDKTPEQLPTLSPTGPKIIMVAKGMVISCTCHFSGLPLNFLIA